MLRPVGGRVTAEQRKSNYGQEHVEWDIFIETGGGHLCFFIHQEDN